MNDLRRGKCKLNSARATYNIGTERCPRRLLFEKCHQLQILYAAPCKPIIDINYGIGISLEFLRQCCPRCTVLELRPSRNPLRHYQFGSKLCSVMWCAQEDYSRSIFQDSLVGVFIMVAGGDQRLIQYHSQCSFQKCSRLSLTLPF